MPEGIKIAIVLCLRCGTIQVQDTNCFREPKSSSEAIVCTIALMENFPLIAVTRKAYLAYRLLTELH